LLVSSSSNRWRSTASTSSGTLQAMRCAVSGATIRIVPVFKRHSGNHVHVRTPIMLGVIVLLVFVLSAFCYYRVGTALP
jgi:hypothetical protein